MCGKCIWRIPVNKILLKSFKVFSFRASKKEDGSVMFDSAMFVLIGAGSSSLFVAFVEYVYQRRKRMRTEAA